MIYLQHIIHFHLSCQSEIRKLGIKMLVNFVTICLTFLSFHWSGVAFWLKFGPQFCNAIMEVLVTLSCPARLVGLQWRKLSNWFLRFTAVELTKELNLCPFLLYINLEFLIFFNLWNAKYGRQCSRFLRLGT